MRIENPDQLARFRGAGVCGFCRKQVRNRDPHHLYTRGAGRLDVSINLIALCSTFAGGDNCHDGFHSTGEPSLNDLLAIVATRENCLQGEIEKSIRILRWLPKGAAHKDVEEAFGRFEANNAVQAMTRRILRESGF